MQCIVTAIFKHVAPNVQYVPNKWLQFGIILRVDAFAAQTSKQQLKQRRYTSPPRWEICRDLSSATHFHIFQCHTQQHEPYLFQTAQDIKFAVHANSTSNSLCPLLLKQQNSFQMIWWGLEEAELIELIRSLMRTWQAEATVTDWIRCKTACRQWIC